MSAEIKSSELFISVFGFEVFVKTWTPDKLENETVIILLHDSLGCVDMWKSFPEKLSEKVNRKVIAYDRLGFGKSSVRSKLPSINFVSEEAEVVLALLKALSINNFSIFGHSVGGAMAVEIAAVLPQNCLSIVTESAQAFVEDRTRAGILKAKEEFAKPEVFAKLEKYHGTKTNWVLDAWIKVWLSPEFSNWSLRDALPKVKCPLLVIHGDQDEYGTLAFPKMISELTGGKSELQIISNCGHVPHREKPEIILDLTKNFY